MRLWEEENERASVSSEGKEKKKDSGNVRAVRFVYFATAVNHGANNWLKKNEPRVSRIWRFGGFILTAGEWGFGRLAAGPASW